MKPKAAASEKEIDELLKQIKQKTGLTQEEIAGRINYNRAYLSQAKKTDSEKLYNVLSKEFKKELENLTSEETHGEDVNIAGLDTSQPIIQVVLNLTYIGKKNADSMDRMTISMDKMADSNLQNSKSIAALVNLIASNSDLASLLTASPASQHMHDDLPAEAFLRKEGSGSLKGMSPGGKKKPVNR